VWHITHRCHKKEFLLKFAIDRERWSERPSVSHASIFVAEGDLPSSLWLWTESIAVGSEAFIEETKEQLGFRAKGRRVAAADEVCALRESSRDYDFTGKNSTLRPKNAYFWDDIF